MMLNGEKSFATLGGWREGMLASRIRITSGQAGGCAETSRVRGRDSATFRLANTLFNDTMAHHEATHQGARWQASESVWPLNLLAYCCFF